MGLTGICRERIVLPPFSSRQAVKAEAMALETFSEHPSRVAYSLGRGWLRVGGVARWPAVGCISAIPALSVALTSASPLNNGGVPWMRCSLS